MDGRVESVREVAQQPELQTLAFVSSLLRFGNESKEV